MSKPADTRASQWTLELDAGRVAWLTFDKPGASANSLSRAAMEEFDGAARRGDAGPSRRPRDRVGQKRLHRWRRRVRVRAGAQPGRGRAFDSRGSRGAAAPRGPALPHGRGDQWVLPRRWAGTCAGVPSPRLRRRSQGNAGLARSHAGNPPGLWRHRARRAAPGGSGRDGPDADGQEPAPRQGAQGPGSWTAWYRRPRCAMQPGNLPCSRGRASAPR
jgi:hypothetical protein